MQVVVIFGLLFALNYSGSLESKGCYTSALGANVDLSISSSDSVGALGPRSHCKRSCTICTTDDQLPAREVEIKYSEAYQKNNSMV